MAVTFPLSVLTVSDLNFLDVSGFLISLFRVISIKGAAYAGQSYWPVYDEFA